jgi:hypothetical protein
MDNGLSPVKTWAGGSAGASRISFGDLTGSADGGQIEWDYLKWTDKAAIVPVPTTPTWAIDASGDWNKPLNWGGTTPNAVGAEADFGGIISSARTIFTDTAITLGALKFDNANTYQITGNGSLTISTSTGSGSIVVAQGTHKINLPITFASDTAIDVAAGGLLKISDPATIAAGKTVTQTGSVSIEAPLTIEAGGALVLAGPSAASVFGAPSLGTGAKIDVKTNSLSVDYRGQASPAATIQSQLASAYAGGAWTGAGITSSSTIAGQTGVGWKEDASSKSIVVKYAYYGDANLDGTVDSSDFSALAAKFNDAAGVWAVGDFNYDGKINALDFNALASNYGQTLPSGAALAALVPEPSSMLALLGLAAVCKRRRK